MSEYWHFGFSIDMMSIYLLGYSYCAITKIKVTASISRRVEDPLDLQDSTE